MDFSALPFADTRTPFGSCPRFHSILEAIFHHACKPEKANSLAVADSQKDLTYRELALKIALIAEELTTKHGMQDGDCVLVQAAPVVDYLCAYYGVEMAHGIAVPIDRMATAETKAYYAEATRATRIIVLDSPTATGCAKAELKKECEKADSLTCISYSALEEAVAPVLEQLKKDCAAIESILLQELPDPESNCAVYFTSGTTGKSKPVLLSHRNCAQGGFNSVSTNAKYSSDVELLTTPIFHAQAASSFRANFILGCASVLADSYSHIDAMRAILQRYHCNCINLTPTAIKMLLDDLTPEEFQELLGSIRLLEIGTAPLDSRRKQQLLSLLPHCAFLYNYGATECSRTVFNLVTNEQDPLDVLGKAVPVCNFKVIDENGDAVEHGKTGRLIFAGDMVMQGYLNHPEATARTIRNGYYYSNDCGFVDETGYIHILGRMDDIINMGGEKISPQEIEDAVMGFSGIKECCLIGGAHEVLGAIPVLYYSVEDDAVASFSESELKAYLRTKLDRMKRPKVYVALTQLPKNSVGKVDRRALKELWHQSKPSDL